MVDGNGLVREKVGGHRTITRPVTGQEGGYRLVTQKSYGQIGASGRLWHQHLQTRNKGLVKAVDSIYDSTRPRSPNPKECRSGVRANRQENF